MRKFRIFVITTLVASMLLSMAPTTLAAENNAITDYGTSDAISMRLIGRYTSGAALAEGGTEIVAFDPKSQTMFSVNGSEKSLDIIHMSALGSGNGVATLPLAKRVALNQLHPSLTNIDDITSVAKNPEGNFIAIAVTANPKTDPGYVLLLDTNGNYLNHVQVGALPDMVTFTPDGTKALVANEGEPNDDYSINPEGSVSIIDLTAGAANAQATLVGFKDAPMTGQVRKSNPDHSFEQNFEPEYIVVSSDSRKAYVALQESNAIAVLDVEAKKFVSVNGLGYKDWSADGNLMDASDKDGKVELKHWPVLSAYMPDGMTLMEINGKEYIITPNEGDSADYDGYSEEKRVEELANQYALNAKLFAGYTQAELDALVAGGLFGKNQLGRLKTTTSAPQNADGKYEAVYGFGARSFTIWNAADMSRVYDSGSDFERITAEALPKFFNSDNAENNFDNRSDDKGPEPETAAAGKVGGVPYAFIGLERAGGIMVYDLSNPTQPQFVKYFSSRDLTGKPVGGDVAPEGLTFVPAVDSPTGKALLLAAHEVSGTIAVYEITPKKTTIQLIHVNDIHSRVFENASAGMGYAKLETLVDQYRRQNPNTLLLDAGDTFHGQTFSTLERGESILKIMNEMEFDAMTAGNHDFNYGTDRLLELAKMADFPVLGANVDRAGQDVLPGTTIKVIDGVRIGIFGLTTPETAYKTHPNNVKGITFVDPVVEAQKQVNFLKDKADIIIGLVHLGMDKSSTDTTDKVAAQVNGIDVIIDGHSHQVISQTINNTLVVQTGEYLKNAGVVTLHFENGKLSNKVSTLISMEKMAGAQPDRQIANLIGSIQAAQKSILSGVVGTTSVPLDGERATVRTKESNLGNLITDAMLAATGADVAMTNGGGIRASIDQGEITTGEVITVLPFGNYIVTINATGAEIVAALQHGAGDYPAQKGAFPQVAGITYAIDPSKPKGEKVHSVMVKGQPIDLNKTYILATNDFMAVGGDEYKMFADNPIIGHFPALDEAVISFIKSQGTVTPKLGSRIVEKAVTNSSIDGSVGTPVGETYVVKSGDTLWLIGLRHGVSWQSIAKLNKLANPDLIYPGQKLIIPAK